ncbi:hypothetical protein DH2020_043418 [Rehmannia glutinosa]|uniref:F-box domain-containing protein n=1 Tax=Rehmannia glutinosa TaxID=99300 RepID=A0ABR0UJV8_REHGL
MAKYNEISVPFSNLPEDIITEILSRLPVKTLLKFRCVSKSWLNLISSPQFVNAHLKNSTKNNMGFHSRLVFHLRYSPSPKVFHTFSLHPKIDDYESLSVDKLVLSCRPCYAIEIVGSCNGLVCVVLDYNSVVLWNPTTRKSKTLPVSDSSLDLSKHGFGYDAANDDYKVVEFGCNYDTFGYKKSTKRNIYSSRVDSWRTMEWPCSDIIDGPSVFVNGVIHWKVCDEKYQRFWAVIAQNVTTETCSSVDLPTLASDDADKVSLGVFGGCLSASFYCHNYMDVWVLKEYGDRESWTKLVRFNYPSVENRFVLKRPKLLFVSKDGGILLKIFGDLIMYRPSQYRVIHHLSNPFVLEAATYSESLISPDFRKD